MVAKPLFILLIKVYIFTTEVFTPNNMCGLILFPVKVPIY